MSDAIYALAGVCIGLSSQWILEGLKKKSTHKERMIGLYADWISAIDSSFYAYISQSRGGSAYSHTENQIRLFEKDERIIKQIEKIHACFPDLRSNDFEEMNFEASHIPDWDDPEFEKELNMIIGMIKKKF